MSYCIVTPYRDRAAHLLKWIDHYSEIVPYTPLYVIEQADDKGFNRGKLFNAAVLELPQYDYYVFHDVDMYLIGGDPDFVFSYPHNPTHLASYVQQIGNWQKKDLSKWTEAYDTYFGGVCALTRQQMMDSNGFSNLMFGWGGEDDSFRKTLIDKGYEIDRRVAYFKCEDHYRNIEPERLKASLEIVKNGMDDGVDGIKNCNYQLISTEIFDKYTHIKVSL